MKGPVASSIFSSGKGNGQRLWARGTAQQNLYGLPIPWTDQNRILRVRWLQADFSTADDCARVGLHPCRGIPIRGDNETVMCAGFEGRSRAVGINGICAGHIGVRLDIPVNIQREGCQSISVSVVSDFANRDRWAEPTIVPVPYTT